MSRSSSQPDWYESAPPSAHAALTLSSNLSRLK